VQKELIKLVQGKKRSPTKHPRSDSKEAFELPDDHIYEDPDESKMVDKISTHTETGKKNVKSEIEEEDYYDYPDVSAMKKKTLERKSLEILERSDQQKQFESMSCADLTTRLFECQMRKLGGICKKEGLDGSFFMNISDSELVETFVLTNIQLAKFKKIRDEGWIPHLK